MTGQLNDRREFTRVPFQTCVEVRAGGSNIRSDAGINISMRGLRMPYPGTVPAAGTSCRASIILQHTRDRMTIEASGTVVRAESGGFAVEFTELDPDSYAHLRRLIQYNAIDPEKAEREFDSHWGIKKRLG